LEKPIDYHCTRSEPAPWFPGKSHQVQTTTFTKKLPVESTEKTLLKSGESFTIANWGCTYNAVTIRYEFPERLSQKQKPEAAFWYQKAVSALKLLASLEARSMFNLELAAQTLTNRLEKPLKPQLGEQFPVEGDGVDSLQTRVTVKRGGVLSNERGFVEVDLLKGPY
jgi:hypothetical protein